MTKKTETATGPGAAESAQSKLNELYTAHQVHTLVQMLFQQLASSWSGVRPWIPPTGDGMTPGGPGRPYASPWHGAMPPGQGPGFPLGVSRPLTYWYP